MKLRDRFKYAYRILRGNSYRPPNGRQPLNVRQMPFALALWNRRSEILPLVNFESYVNEGYKANSVVYACISKIATTAPAAALVVEREVDGKREIVSDHRLLRAFQNPNPHLSAFAFKELIHTYINLIGEAYIIKVGFGGKPGWQTRPAELYLPRPDLMYPVPGEKKLLGFVHRSLDGTRTPFTPEEVIHVKRPNPNDPYEGFGRGLSPLSAAATLVDVDNRISVMVKDFFENGAIVAGLLKLKHPITDDDYIGQLHNRLKQQYTGDKHWYDMILDADADYQRIGLNFDEMALPSLRGLTESRICSVFDVPAILVGVQVGLKHEGGFTSSWPEARKALWMDKIMPDNQRIAEGLTLGLANYLEENEFVGFDYNRIGVLQDNRNEAVKRATEAWLGDLLTQNEARREINAPITTAGDVFYSQYKKQFAPPGLAAVTSPEEDAQDEPKT